MPDLRSWDTRAAGVAPARSGNHSQRSRRRSGVVIAAPPEAARLDPILNTFRAPLAGVGAYYLVGALVLTGLSPVRYSLPTYGTISYDPLITILAAVTFVGVTAAAGVAYACGGWRAFALIAALQTAAALSAILPYLGQSAPWTTPPDLVGLTPASVLLLSQLTAVPALLLGLALGARAGQRRAPTALMAAGAYYLSAVAMSLPTPQLDLRLALPFTAHSLPDAWHVVAVAMPALVAAVLLSGRVRPIWKTAALVGVLALAGAAPAEVARLAGIPSPYVPVSLVAVPALSAGLAAAVVVARRALIRRRPLPFATPSRLLAAAGGAAAAFIAVAAWAVFGSMPTPSDRTGTIGAYMRTGDERKLIACVTSGSGEELRGSSAGEDQTTVTLAVTLRRAPSWYFHDLAGVPLPVVVALRDPLGSRTVIDRWSGQPVPEAVRANPGAALHWC